jgi:hypothetical protein
MPLFQGSNAWNSLPSNRLKEWFDQYLHWLTTSSIALDEEQELNNHGTYYDVQIAAVALHLGKPWIARPLLELAKRKTNWQPYYAEWTTAARAVKNEVSQLLHHESEWLNGFGDYGGLCRNRFVALPLQCRGKHCLCLGVFTAVC